MAETEHTLTRQNAEEQLDTGIPKGPDMTDNAHTLVCKEIMAEMKIEHDKYEEIVKKIRTSIHQLFLVKCKVDEKEYYFLAEYKNDGFFDYFGKNKAFGEIQQCMHNKVKTNRPAEEKRLLAIYGDGPSLGFKFLHNDRHVTIKIGPPNNRMISYEDFKNTFIPLKDAFMYKNMPKTIDIGNIVGLKKPALPAELPMSEVKEEEVTHEVIDSDDEFTDVESDPVNEGDMKVEELVGGGRKKRRKKRSRSKKKRRKRKNRTKKN